MGKGGLNIGGARFVRFDSRKLKECLPDDFRDYLLYLRLVRCATASCFPLRHQPLQIKEATTKGKGKGKELRNTEGKRMLAPIHEDPREMSHTEEHVVGHGTCPPSSLGENPEDSGNWDIPRGFPIALILYVSLK